MKITDLMDGIFYQLISGDAEKDITALCYDSRKVEKDAIFVCLVGFDRDGHDYIDAAIANGASAILLEKDIDIANKDVTVIKVSNTREALSHIAVNFFGDPAKKLTIVGVTGTKGKTTTTHMCKSIMEAANEKVGMIGTVGAFIGDKHIELANTTPESYELQKLFREMLDAGCKTVFMEVSSQAVKKHRIDGIKFKIGAFTNLTPDHISPGEHANFEEYKYYKKEFFRQVETAVMNIDNEYSSEMAEFFKDYKKVSTKENADLYASDAKNVWDAETLGVSFSMHGDVEADITIGIPGRHNVENAVVAAEICKALGASDDAIINGLKNVDVSGRTQIVKAAAPRGTFIIDYAHNAASCESVLTTLKAYRPAKLTCLFGGGGNRAVARRHDMGAAASKYADYIVLTEDNPRFEEIDEINKTIIEGINEYGCPYEVIYDRKEAIEHLLDISKPGEMVLLMGKGHENYQDVKGVKTYFCEKEIIEDYMKKCQ